MYYTKYQSLCHRKCHRQYRIIWMYLDNILTHWENHLEMYSLDALIALTEVKDLLQNICPTRMLLTEDYVRSFLYHRKELETKITTLMYCTRFLRREHLDFVRFYLRV